MKSIASLSMVVLLLLAGCGAPEVVEERDEHHEGEAEHHAEHASAPAGMVRIDDEMLRDLRITTTNVESRAGGEGVTVLGEVGVNEDAYAEVGCPVEARVTRPLVSAGDAVRAGQPLVALHSMALGTARSEHAAALARERLAAQTLERKRGLVAERIAPQRELEEAEAAARAAQADVAAAAAALRAMGIPPDDGPPPEDASQLVLRSPIAGTVIARDVVAGRLVGASAPLFRIADLSRLWLTVHAFERDAVRIDEGSEARVTFSALPGMQFEARVALVGRQVEVSSRTIPVRLEIANPEGLLRPGMSATAWLPVGGTGALVIAVPSASLQRMQDGWCVFLPRGAGLFEVRPVGRGRDLGGEVEIVSGLQPGETIVVEGAFLLKAEAEKSRGEGAHHDH